RSESTPMAKEVNPRLVFERLFASQAPGDAGAGVGKRERYRLSVLDFVMEDARQLKTRLGSNDQRKLDEYLAAVRALEIRIAKSGKNPSPAKVTKYDELAGIPTNYKEHLHLMAAL